MLNKAEQQKRQVVVDREAFKQALEYLRSFRDSGVTDAVIKLHVKPPASRLEVTTLSEAYRRLLESAQNRNMAAGVIGRAIGRIDNLGPILFHFNPKRVVSVYQGDSDRVMQEIVKRLKPKKAFRTTRRSIWPLFCKTIISGATFLSQFHEIHDFYAWCRCLYRDMRSRPALPLILSLEIDGIGFPLACDFLKEIGFRQFAKPDVHIKTIFKGLGLVEKAAHDYSVYKAIVRVAGNNGISPYQVDKVFWLVGSGNFYASPDVGKDGKVRTNRDEFIRRTRRRMCSIAESS
jgi:hypothetical protein